MRLYSSCRPLFVRSSGSGLRVWPWAFASLVGLCLSGGWVDRRHTQGNEPTADAFWCARQAGTDRCGPGAGELSCACEQARRGSAGRCVISLRTKGPFAVQLKAESAPSATVPALAVDGPLVVPASRPENPPAH